MKKDLLEAVVGALRFYADPPKGEPVPDFYDELAFGERAQDVLEEVLQVESRLASEPRRVLEALLMRRWYEAHRERWTSRLLKAWGIRDVLALGMVDEAERVGNLTDDELYEELRDLA